MTGYAGIFELLRDAYDLDFAYYKPTTVSRRIDRRMSLTGIVRAGEYVARLKRDPEELDQLYCDLLIGVTRFFRDPEAFDELADKAMPGMLTGSRAKQGLRLWVPGCATGEEAYSLGILLIECAERLEVTLDAKIFATDVHAESLRTASAGIYTEEAMENVSAERRARFFKPEGDGYAISPEVRELIVFAKHNVLKDPPFTRLDFISCRNLLIYLQPLAKKKVLSLFLFALNAGSTLFLGPSENLGELGSRFEAMDGHWKIFRKTQDAPLPPGIGLPRSRQRDVTNLDKRFRQQLCEFPDMRMPRVYDVLLERVIPPSVLIDETREVLHVFGDAGRYLSFRGRASLDVLNMVHDSLRMALSTAIHNAQSEGRKVTSKNVPLPQADFGPGKAVD